MQSRLKLGVAIGLSLVFCFIGQPANLHAADEQCVRLNINTLPVLSYTYNPSTQTMTHLSIESEVSLNWIDTSLSGHSSAISFQSSEDVYNTLRFFDTETQETHDASRKAYYYIDSYGSVASVGWSPDEQFYALPVYDDDTPGAFLTVFDKEGQIVASAPYNQGLGSTFWVWSPQSDKIAIVQPEEDQQYGIFTHLSILSLTGTLVRAKINEPLDPTNGWTALWSPNGRFVAVADTVALRVVESTTGEAVEVSQSAWVANPGMDLVWTADSEYLLHLIAPNWNEDGLVDIQRYSVTKRKSTVLMDHMAYLFSASVYLPVSKNPGYMVVRKDAGETVQFFLVNGMTGEERELAKDVATDISLNASYQWSPKGTALILGSETTLILQPESTTVFKLPEQHRIVFESVHWSDNEEWIGFLTDKLDGTYTPWIVNVKTGVGRSIPNEGTYAFIMPGNQGEALFVEAGTTLNLIAADDNRVVVTTSLIEVPAKMYANIAARWSPDGMMVAFVEISPEGDSYLIHVVRSDGATVSKQVLPPGIEPLGSIEWVACP